MANTDQPMTDLARRGEQARTNPSAHRIALALTLAGLAVTLTMAACSNGFYQDDDCCLYQLGQEGWSNVHKALHNWGRPGYLLPAMTAGKLFGVFGCRVLSALQTAAVAWLAYRIAVRITPAPPADCLSSRRFRDRAAAVAPALAPLAVWLQPLASLLGMTTLTETPTALYLTLAVWLYLRGNRVWACAAFSPALISRYEMLGLTPIWALAVVIDALRISGWRVRAALSLRWPWLCLAAILWAPLAYVLASWAVHQPYCTSPISLFSQQYSDAYIYGQGTWDHFLFNWLTQTSGGGVLALAVAGLLTANRRVLLPAALAAGWFVLHTLIYMKGMHGGYARFLVPVCGLVAAAAGCGLAGLLRARWTLPAAAALGVLSAWCYYLIDVAYLLPIPVWVFKLGVVLFAALAGTALLLRGDRIRQTVAGLTIALALSAAGLHYAGLVRPLRLGQYDPLQRSAVAAVNDIRRSEFADRPALSGYILVPYLWPNARLTPSYQAARDLWADAPEGTLFFWDGKYGRLPNGELGPLYDDLNRGGRLLFREGPEGNEVCVFLRDGASAHGNKQR